MKHLLPLIALLLAGCAAQRHCTCPPSIEKQIDYVLLGLEGKVTPDQARCLVEGARTLDTMAIIVEKARKK